MDKALEIIKKISLLLISSIAALALVEVAFYSSASLRQKYSLEKFITSSPRLERLLNARPYLYQPSKITGYERIPNSAPNINSFGLIGEEFDINKKEDTFRILVLGDSIIEQNYFVERLKEKLNNSSFKADFEVINAGVSGYEAWHYERFLKYKGIQLKPDMVLLGFCLADFDSRKRIYYKTKEGFKEFTIPAEKTLDLMPINIFLFKYSYVYRLVILNLEKLFSNSGNRPTKDEGLYHVGAIKKICMKNKIPLICFIWPYLKPYEEYENVQKEEYATMAEVLNYFHIDYIDLHDYFPEGKRKSFKIWDYDFTHPSEEAHEISAEALFKHLAENYKDKFYDRKLSSK